MMMIRCKNHLIKNDIWDKIVSRQAKKVDIASCKTFEFVKAAGQQALYKPSTGNNMISPLKFEKNVTSCNETYFEWKIEIMDNYTWLAQWNCNKPLLSTYHLQFPKLKMTFYTKLFSNRWNKVDFVSCKTWRWRVTRSCINPWPIKI